MNDNFLPTASDIRSGLRAGGPFVPLEPSLSLNQKLRLIEIAHETQDVRVKNLCFQLLEEHRAKRFMAVPAQPNDALQTMQAAMEAAVKARGI